MPVLTASGAGVRRHRRWIFQDLDVSAAAGEIVAVVGPPGSGRTTVLLALARRFKLSAGQVAIEGRPALAYVPGVCEPEDVLTVAEHIRERQLLAGAKREEEADVRQGDPAAGLEPGLRGFELSPFQRHLLGLTLAMVEQPSVVALDAVDEGLSEAERKELSDRVGELAAAGVVVVLAGREVDESRVTTVVRLGGSGIEESK